ncbi:MAG: hypothetical protein ACKPKO_11765, partial [Candidatus Fonsibacter sp.]
LKMPSQGRTVGVLWLVRDTPVCPPIALMMPTAPIVTTTMTNSMIVSDWRRRRKAESDPRTSWPFPKAPSIYLIAMETQPMASKPAPAEQTHTLAGGERSQQPPDVIPASTPAVMQPI